MAALKVDIKGIAFSAPGYRLMSPIAMRPTNVAMMREKVKMMPTGEHPAPEVSWEDPCSHQDCNWRCARKKNFAR